MVLLILILPQTLFSEHNIFKIRFLIRLDVLRIIGGLLNCVH